MALTQGARNKIKSIVQSAKKLLMKEFESQLQQYYGIRPDGSCFLVEELTSREASVIETARLLRQRLHYLEEGIAGNDKAPEAVRQLVREQAFTILNRFAAVRMSEERNIIRESIRKGYNSEGFQVYDQLTGGAKTAEQFTRYNWYIGHVFDELAIDLPAVFDRFSPYALLFPSEKVLLELLDIINDEDLNIYREAGHQPINLWTEDETIGWIYQYYNSREEISEMREASGAPRNSRELAVRNQFFTPRYVVQFLVDNSLGRQWFEMTIGQTALIDSCQYMVKREQEIFLEKGEEIPEAKIEGANYIEYRELKDPREILMLDPACGSMHFGLYCFDLFEQIYLEAWDNHPELMTDLRDKYMRDDFIKRIPGYILRYNIHGVDIDPRAIQIAGLSLWLRAQKSYDKLGLQPGERPAISKSNLVIAEPMPGDDHLLSEFTKSLPGPIGKLVRVIWDKMQLAGESGLLLKIEEELKKEIQIAKEEYKEFKDTSAQSTLFDSPVESKAAEMAAIYGKGQKITKDFFDTAEEEVLKALKGFAENAEGEDAFQKLLFAEDTARGFAFIELCRKRYDVVVMNPPFGASSLLTEAYYKSSYKTWGKNILCCFFSRMNDLVKSEGNVSCLFDRTVCVKSSYEKFRVESFIGKIKFVADTGWGVLDANVETSAYVLDKIKSNQLAIFYDLRQSNSKPEELKRQTQGKEWIERDSNLFLNLPNSIIGYFFSEEITNLFSNNKNIRIEGLQARDGHTLDAFQHNRVYWELPKEICNYSIMYNGGSYSLFYYPYRDACKYGDEGNLIRENKRTILRNLGYQGESGVGYGKRGDFFDAHLLKKEVVFTKEGQAINRVSDLDSLLLLSYLNSSLVQYLLSLYAGQHKASGYLNLIPLPSRIGFSDISRLIKIKRESFLWDETCLETHLLISNISNSSIETSITNFNKNAVNQQIEYDELVAENDHYWLNHIDASIKLKAEVENFKEKRPKESLYQIENISIKEDQYNRSACFEIIQNLTGIIFKRWAPIKTFDFNNTDDFSSLFDAINLNEESVAKSEVIVSTGFSSSDILMNSVKELINENWPSDSSLEFIEETIGSSINRIINNPHLFFDYHLNRYTKSRRIAPIYWLLGVPSGKFNVWLYYPALNENTLFSVINELVDPKIKEIAKEVEVIEMKDTAKELNDQKEFLAELKDFKEELLQVAQLPYRPNQDDGVLITAAPLHNLFRHTKWKKATQDCWKKLEKGEYDWAHLAYSIWPDRVRNKCIKDLSMAIAHGLENICEVKSKEKKVKKLKEIKADTQSKLM